MPGDLDKCITVIDIEKVKMSDFAGESLEFVRKSVTIANQHYPERSDTPCLPIISAYYTCHSCSRRVVVFRFCNHLRAEPSSSS